MNSASTVPLGVGVRVCAVVRLYSCMHGCWRACARAWARVWARAFVRECVGSRTLPLLTLYVRTVRIRVQGIVGQGEHGWGQVRCFQPEQTSHFAWLRLPTPTPLPTPTLGVMAAASG